MKTIGRTNTKSSAYDSAEAGLGCYSVKLNAYNLMLKTVSTRGIALAVPAGTGWITKLFLADQYEEADLPIALVQER